MAPNLDRIREHLSTLNNVALLTLLGAMAGFNDVTLIKDQFKGPSAVALSYLAYELAKSFSV